MSRRFVKKHKTFHGKWAKRQKIYFLFVLSIPKPSKNIFTAACPFRLVGRNIFSDPSYRAARSCVSHTRLPAIPFAPGRTARKKPPFLDASMSEMSPREVDFCAQLCQAYLLVKSVTAFCRIATVANSPPIRPWFARHPFAKPLQFYASK